MASPHRFWNQRHLWWPVAHGMEARPETSSLDASTSAKCIYFSHSSPHILAIPVVWPPAILHRSSPIFGTLKNNRASFKAALAKLPIHCKENRKKAFFSLSLSLEHLSSSLSLSRFLSRSLSSSLAVRPFFDPLWIDKIFSSIDPLSFSLLSLVVAFVWVFLLQRAQTLLRVTASKHFFLPFSWIIDVRFKHINICQAHVCLVFAYSWTLQMWQQRFVSALMCSGHMTQLLLVCLLGAMPWW